MRSIIAFVLLCCFVMSAHSPAQGVTEVANCAPDQGPCTAAAAGRQIIFDISPKPVKAMKELIFTIRATGRNTAPAILLDLSMPGMYMGRNEVVLKKNPDGSYSGKGIIPRCPSGRMLWRAAVTVPGAGKVSYTFNVSQ